jgi:DUF1680 family protein
MERPTAFTIRLRIPGWAKGRPVPGDLYHYMEDETLPITLDVKGRPVPLDIEDGYASIRRLWRPGDRVTLELPMSIRRVTSHEKVTGNFGRIALERGPLVYCVEGMDHGSTPAGLMLHDEALLRTEWRPDFLGGITVIQGDDPPILAIPYYAWSHRGEGEMAVWIPRQI